MYCATTWYLLRSSVASHIRVHFFVCPACTTLACCALLVVVLHATPQALRVNKSLTELTLRHNDVGQEGLVALGNALYKNSTLQQLSLWGNSFDDVSCGLFFDLYETRIPYVGLSLDCQVYVVDDVHCVAEKAL